MKNPEKKTRILILFVWILVVACVPVADPVVLTVIPSKTLPTSTPTNLPAIHPTLTVTLDTFPTPTLTTKPITIQSTRTPTTVELACWKEPGQIVLDQLETELLAQPLDLRVYLPPCYQQLTDQRFPVLYLIHGQSFNDDQWDRLGADETADRLIADGEASPFLIVMPRDRSWSQPDEDPFGQVVIDLLLPYIDRVYRTRPGRDDRAVGGLSRGASWAIHFAFKYWELFGAVGGHSPPVFWSDVPYMKRWLDEIPPSEMPRIFLDIGRNDRQEIMQSAVWFEGLLTERGIAHEWYLFSGFHDEAYWSTHLEQYLRWYTEVWMP